MQMDWALLLAVVAAAFALGLLTGQIASRRRERAVDDRAAAVLEFGPRDSLILETQEHISQDQAARMQEQFKYFAEAPEPRVLAIPQGWRVAAHLKRGSSAQGDGHLRCPSSPSAPVRISLDR